MNEQEEAFKGRPNHIQANPFRARPCLTMSWPSSGSEGTKHTGHKAIAWLSLSLAPRAQAESAQKPQVCATFVSFLSLGLLHKEQGEEKCVQAAANARA